MCLFSIRSPAVRCSTSSLLGPDIFLNTLSSDTPNKESCKMLNKDHRWKYIGLVVRFVRAERLAMRAGSGVNVCQHTVAQIIPYEVSLLH